MNVRKDGADLPQGVEVIVSAAASLLLNTASPVAITHPHIAIKTMEITAAKGKSVPVSEIFE